MAVTDEQAVKLFIELDKALTDSLGKLIWAGEDRMRNRRLFRGNLFLLLITIILFSASRGKDKATTMKLIKTDGEVGVGDEKGKSVDLIDNLGLYNGYRIGTQTKSFGRRRILYSR